MEKKATKPFKEYAQRWRHLVAQVHPTFSNKERMSTFIGILCSPFYDRMISNYHQTFLTLLQLEKGLSMMYILVELLIILLKQWV